MERFIKVFGCITLLVLGAAMGMQVPLILTQEIFPDLNVWSILGSAVVAIAVTAHLSKN